MSYEAWGEPDARPFPKPRLPVGVAHCSPTKACPQRGSCARCVAKPRANSITVDASLCLDAGWCPMFIDARGAKLLCSEAARKLLAA